MMGLNVGTILFFSTVQWMSGHDQKLIDPPIAIDVQNPKAAAQKLYESGAYRGIDILEDNGKKVTTLVLWKKTRIQSISFKGIPEGVERDFNMLAQENLGRESTAARLAHFEERLRTSLKDRGYPFGNVFVYVRKTEGDETRVTLSIETQAGVRTVLNKIATNIPDPEVEARVLKILGIKKNEPLDRRWMEERMNEFPAQGAKNLMFKPRIRTFSIDLQNEGQAATLSLQFEPIRFFSLSLKGELGGVSEKELLGFLTEKLSYVPEPKDLAQVVEGFYKEKGFLSTHVSVRIFPLEKPGTDRLEVTVSSGPRVRFEGVKWIGVQQLNESDLSDFLSGFLNDGRTGGYFYRDALDRGLEQLPIYFKNRGLFQARVQFVQEEFNDQKDGVRLVIHVVEGVATRLRKVQMPGLDPVMEELLKENLGLNEGDLLNLKFIEDFLNDSPQILKREGYFFVRSGEEIADSVLHFSSDFQWADLIFPVELGPKAHFGGVQVFGIDKTKEKVVIREVRWEEGEPYSADSVDETRAALSRTGLFRSVRIEFVPVTGEGFLKKEMISVPVEIYVDERNAGTFEFGAGVRSDDGFKLFSGVAYRNLGGMNRTASSRVDLDARFPHQFEFVEPTLTVTYIEPWLGPFPLQLRTDLVLQRADEIKNDFLSGKASTELTYFFTKNIYLRHLLYEIEAIQRFNIRRDDLVIDRSTFENDRIAVLGPGLFFDYRDDSFNPTKGWFASVVSRFSAPEVGSDADIRFFQVESKIKGYYPVMNRIVLALFGSHGFVRRLGSQFRIPREYLFYLGGRTSLRSYSTDIIRPDDSEIGAVAHSQVVLFRGEMRFTVWEDFGLATFWDGGTLFINQRNVYGFRQSIGAGLRYKTPVGPFALDFAYTADDLAEIPKERGWRIHFSVGVF